jgi:hypothetical protein
MVLGGIGRSTITAARMTPKTPINTPILSLAICTS